MNAMDTTEPQQPDGVGITSETIHESNNRESDDESGSLVTPSPYLMTPREELHRHAWVKGKSPPVNRCIVTVTVAKESEVILTIPLQFDEDRTPDMAKLMERFGRNRSSIAVVAYGAYMYYMHRHKATLADAIQSHSLLSPTRFRTRFCFPDIEDKRKISAVEAMAFPTMVELLRDPIRNAWFTRCSIRLSGPTIKEQEAMGSQDRRLPQALAQLSSIGRQASTLIRDQLQRSRPDPVDNPCSQQLEASLPESQWATDARALERMLFAQEGLSHQYARQTTGPSSARSSISRPVPKQDRGKKHGR